MFLIVINTTSGGTRVRGAGAVPAGGRQLQFAGPPPPAVARRTAWSSTGRRFHSARVTRAGAQGPGRVRRPVSRLCVVRVRTAPTRVVDSPPDARATRRSSTGHALRGSIAASRGFLHTRRVTQPHTGAHTTARRLSGLHHGESY